MTDRALQAGLDYLFGFFERGYRRQTGRYDREVRRPEVFAAIAQEHDILPPPQRTILITGSKGKGSCARLLAAYLRQQGKRVGLVLTPEERHHLDRIRVDGQPIDTHTFLDLLESFMPALEATAQSSGDTYYHPPTAIFLLIALRYFRQQDVDYIVIEGGRGARYDEIGQLKAAVGIVTSILPEHLGKLGPGLREIAQDKFSLAERCTALVCSEQAWAQVRALGILLPKHKTRVAPAVKSGTGHRPAWLTTADSLAREALGRLGIQPGSFPADENIFASCQVITASTSAVLHRSQTVFLDGAIAADCLDFDYIDSTACMPRAVVLGMSADKDTQAVAAAFAARGYAQQYFFEPISKLNHLTAPSSVSPWTGCFDAERGLDAGSRAALLEVIARHERVYVAGVQIFLRSVRNALSR